MGNLKENKRIVRLGFLKPSEFGMEGNTIYVSLEEYAGNIGATAESRVDFNYDSHSIAGNLLSCKGRETTTKDGTRKYGNPIVLIGYENFVKIIIEKNNGILEDRCYSDGATLASRIIEHERNFKKILNIK